MKSDEHLVPIEGQIHKKLGLIVFASIYPFFIAQTFISHLFVDTEISLFSVLVLFLCLPFALKFVRKAQKDVSKAYTFIPGAFSLLCFYLLYAQLAS